MKLQILSGRVILVLKFLGVAFSLAKTISAKIYGWFSPFYHGIQNENANYFKQSQLKKQISIRSVFKVKNFKR